MNMKTVSSALAYDDQAAGKTTILVVHQAIHIITMGSNSLCPMQVWMNDVKVDKTPKFLTENPTDITHAVSGKDADGIQVTIPLSLKGVSSYFLTRKSTEEEFNSCPQFDLSYEAPIWDPHSEIFRQQKRKCSLTIVEYYKNGNMMMQECPKDSFRI